MLEKQEAQAKAQPQQPRGKACSNPMGASPAATPGASPCETTLRLSRDQSRHFTASTGAGKNTPLITGNRECHFNGNKRSPVPTLQPPHRGYLQRCLPPSLLNEVLRDAERGDAAPAPKGEVRKASKPWEGGTRIEGQGYREVRLNPPCSCKEAEVSLRTAGLGTGTHSATPQLPSPPTLQQGLSHVGAAQHHRMQGCSCVARKSSWCWR